MPSSSISYCKLASAMVTRSLLVMASTEEGFTSSAEMDLGEKRLPHVVTGPLTSSYPAIEDPLSLNTKPQGPRYGIVWLPQLHSKSHARPENLSQRFYGGWRRRTSHRVKGWRPTVASPW